MITIIDYGAGNLRSIQRAIDVNGGESVISGDPDRIAAADKVVLPGVGNAKAAMDQLNATGIADAVKEQAAKGTPILGVCLGMQLLFGDQEEGPTTGLKLLEGTVAKLPTDHKIPHMGWNTVSFSPESKLGDLSPAAFYFVHSYIAKPDQPEDIAGQTDYGVRFPAIVIRNNIWGMQFHPEKSHEAGLELVARWLRS